MHAALTLCPSDLDLLGADLVGGYDLAVYTRQMDSLKVVTVAIARALLRGGEKVIDQAIAQGQGGWFSKALPGDATRKNAKGHLAWHAQRLAGLSDPTAPYDAALDLKKWVLQAYVEANAVEEGRAFQDAAWQDMWTEIGTELAALPQEAVQAAGRAVGLIMSSATQGIAAGLGVPRWIFIGGVTVLAVGLGFGLFKVLLVAAPAVVPAVVRRYLP